MGLKETIRGDLKTAIKAKDGIRKDALRVVLGELERSASKASDDETVIKVLQKLRKSEKELLEKSRAAHTSPYLEVIESYLPQGADEAEIRQWISDHIDFDTLNSKMQAMKPIMAHFGSRADGGQVRRILDTF